MATVSTTDTPSAPPTLVEAVTEVEERKSCSGDRRRSAGSHSTVVPVDVGELDNVNALVVDVDTDRNAPALPLVPIARTATRGTAKGAGSGTAEEPLPPNNMWLVMPALGLVAFISALDQTIISTALPTIAAELGATPSQYSWVGTSYLLAQTIMTPINGRVTDIIGRKPMLYASIIIMLVFSAFCGAAKNIRWLIVARAFAGLGGGSIVGMTTIVISDIVPLHKIGEYQGNLGVAYGFASVLGPVLGGLLTERVSWRWCFYINIPCCAISLVLLFFTLKLNRSRHTTFAEVRRTFDFLGLALIIVGAALTIIGFSTAADNGFGVPGAYAVIAAGGVVLFLAVVHFLTTKRNAIVPRRMLRTRTPLFFMLGSFFQSLMFVAAGYLLPQFFQGVRGSGALSAGLQLLPFAVGSAVFGVMAGQITSRFRIVRPLVWIGYAIAAVAYLLWYQFFTATVTMATQEGLLLLASVGVGISLMPPILVIQAAMPWRDMAASTSTWVLMRSLGATVGLAIFTAILNTGIRQRFVKIPGYGTVFQVPEGTTGYKALHDLPEGETRTQVLEAFADSVKMCFVVGAAFLFAALLLTLCTKSYSLNRRRDAEPSDDASGEATAVASEDEKEKDDKMATTEEVETKETDKSPV